MGFDSVVSHWSTLIESFQASPLAFYQSVEAALLRREVPQTKNSRVEHREAGLFSANREYLRIQREKLTFDVCAAPFGTGFFVSWWLVDEIPKLNPLLKVLMLFVQLGIFAWLLAQFGLIAGTFVAAVLVVGFLAVVNVTASSGDTDDSFVRALPLIGTLYALLFKPATYYRIDTMEMFQRAAHNSVLEVIDAMTAEKGLKLLAETERKPIMRELYSRKGL
jgi:hypothetical protein